MANLPTHKAIVEYWQPRVCEQDLGTDWDEAEHRCWRCGVKRSGKKSKLEKCHIIPAQLGGPDTVDNLVLLCWRCHAEAPNINSKTVMWDWIKTTKADFYDTFWTLRVFDEVEKLYGVSVEQLAAQALQKKGIGPTRGTSKFMRELKETYSNAGLHFGQGGYNEATSATAVYQAFQNLIQESTP